MAFWKNEKFVYRTHSGILQFILLKALLVSKSFVSSCLLLYLVGWCTGSQNSGVKRNLFFVTGLSSGSIAETFLKDLGQEVFSVAVHFWADCEVFSFIIEYHLLGREHYMQFPLLNFISLLRNCKFNIIINSWSKKIVSHLQGLHFMEKG